MLPFEIWKEISLILPYNHLAVSKELNKIYEEDWFEKKVKLRYPYCKQHDNSWRFLYQRSLKSGTIVSCGKSVVNTNLEGIKRSTYYNADLLTLTFDGNLYFSNTLVDILIDENVLDIGVDCYIKKYEWYVLFETGFILVAENDEPFLSCLYFSGYYLAITKNKIYQYVPNVKLIITDFECGIKIIHSNDFILIQKDDGTLYEYKVISQKIEKSILADTFGPIDKLFDGCAKLTNGTIVRFEYNAGRYVRQFSAVPTKLPNNNLREAMLLHSKFGYSSFCPKLLVLLDNDVYEVTDKQLALFKTNAKYLEDGYLVI